MLDVLFIEVTLKLVVDQPLEGGGRLVRFQTGYIIKEGECFYGITITENIKIKNISIKLGNKAIILLLGNAIEGVKLMDIFVIFKYFFSLK